MKTFLAGLALALTLATTGTATLAADGPIRIGTVLSVTGPLAYLGDPAAKTLDLWVDRLNAAGGVLGRKLELVSYDDVGEAAKANGLVKRLIDNDHVDVVIGSHSTGATMAMVPVVENAHMPLISPAGGAVIIDPVKKWVFKTPPTDRMAAERVYGHMKAKGITKIALLSETSGFGQSARKEAQAVAAGFGVSIVADEAFAPKDTDMVAQLTKIRDVGAQAVFVLGTNPAAAIVTKNYRQVGLTQPLYQAHSVTSQEYVDLAGATAEGVVAPALPVVVFDDLPKSDPQYPVLADYVGAYRAKFGQDPAAYGASALDALLLYVDAVRRAGTTDRTAVRDALEKTSGFLTTASVVSLSATDHLGLKADTFRMIEVRGGKWHLAP